MDYNTKEITSLLAAISSGDKNSRNKLFTIVYKHLHELAHLAMGGKSMVNLSQTTDLVHEAYMRLVPENGRKYQDRVHFFRVAGKAMRRIIVSKAREMMADKRGGGKVPLSIEEVKDQVQLFGFFGAPPEYIVEVGEVLSDLEALDERKSSIVEQRFFVGLTIEETAKMLEISPETVNRDWKSAKAWLHDRIQHHEGK